MDDHRFAVLSNVLFHAPSRRHVLRGLAGLGIVMGVSGMPDDAEAKNKKKKGKKKKKKQKPVVPPTVPPPPQPPTGVPNAYGCLSVNVICTNADECCTGICEGGVCRAHDTGTCNQEAAGFCLAASPGQTLCNNSMQCACLETTGGSKVCGAVQLSPCADCRTDADCLALGHPAGSSCVPVATGNCAGTCPSGMRCSAPCGTIPDSM